MNNINDTIQLGDCFKLLAACFYEPDRHLFIEEKIGEKLGLLLDDLSPEGARAARGMKNCLEELDQEHLSIDHAALFVGPFELAAPPYGSVYIEKNRRVMGESTMEAARYYQEAGLGVDVKEPPDHIAIELEFLYYLCSKEAGFAKDGLHEEANRLRDMQTRFYHDAMKPWVRSFCDAIRSGTENQFYVSLARCLDCFFVSCDKIYSQTELTPTV